MPYRKEQFINGEIYHIVIKGIDGNVIFKDIDDHYRGIFSIYEFNTAKPVTIQKRREARARFKKAIKESRGRVSTVAPIDDGRDKLVGVLAFCFMPNHLHLLLRQLKEGGIIKFMQKIGSGYGGYFNRKYARQGYVTQKRFTAVPIRNEEQLKTVFVYIHANPISLIEPEWKEAVIQDAGKAIEFVENYKWSSYPDYIAKKNFPSVTEREFMLKLMGGEKGCKEFVGGWIKYKGKIREFAELSLE